jgi:hypothetical protein
MKQYICSFAFNWRRKDIFSWRLGVMRVRGSVVRRRVFVTRRRDRLYSCRCPTGGILLTGTIHGSKGWKIYVRKTSQVLGACALWFRHQCHAVMVVCWNAFAVEIWCQELVSDATEPRIARFIAVIHITANIVLNQKLKIQNKCVVILNAYKFIQRICWNKNTKQFITMESIIKGEWAIVIFSFLLSHYWRHGYHQYMYIHLTDIGSIFFLKYGLKKITKQNVKILSEVLIMRCVELYFRHLAL